MGGRTAADARFRRQQQDHHAAPTDCPVGEDEGLRALPEVRVGGVGRDDQNIGRRGDRRTQNLFRKGHTGPVGLNEITGKDAENTALLVQHRVDDPGETDSGGQLLHGATEQVVCAAAGQQQILLRIGNVVDGGGGLLAADAGHDDLGAATPTGGDVGDDIADADDGVGLQHLAVDHDAGAVGHFPAMA